MLTNKYFIYVMPWGERSAKVSGVVGVSLESSTGLSKLKNRFLESIGNICLNICLNTEAEAGTGCGGCHLSLYIGIRVG
jgi:hypothetical protein